MRRKRNSLPIAPVVYECPKCGTKVTAAEITRNVDGDIICTKCGIPFDPSKK
jgi:predicted RNA-binding Zn-ribbon protein involved in translation (DUF1610 family)